MIVGQVVDAGSRDTHFAEVFFGDGTSEIVVVDPTTRTFEARHIYADDGSYVVTAVVVDNAGDQGSASSTVTVQNLAPTNVTVNLSGTRTDEGTPFTVTGSLEDPGAGDVVTVVIDWGDGTTSDAAVDQTTGAFSVTHRYLDDDPSGTPSDDYAISITVSDDGGAASTFDVGVITVDNVDPTVEHLTTTATGEIQEDPDEPVTVFVTVLDAGEIDTHTALVDWGDGTAPETVALGALGVSVAIADHVYGQIGEFTITVAIEDDDGGTATRTVVATVGSPVPDIIEFAPVDDVVTEGDEVVVTGSVVDANQADTHTATIMWGDGSTEVVAVDPATRTFEARHVYVDDAEYQIVAAVTDDGGDADLATTVVTVENADPALVSVQLSTRHLNEGESTTVTGALGDPGIEDLLAVEINWGDGTTSEAVVDQTSRTFSATHQYLDDDPSGTTSDDYVISLTVSDEDGGKTTTEIDVVTVDNVDPTVEDLTTSATGVTQEDPDEPVTVFGTVLDVGEVDTHTALIDWGDGSAPETVAIAATGVNVAIASHVYGRAGEFTVTVTVEDDDGGATTSTVMTVVGSQVPVIVEFGPVHDVVTEGSEVVVTGLVFDLNQADAHAATISWGDGNTEVVEVDPATRTFEARHVYVDDAEYEIAVVVADNGGDTDSASTAVIVENADPVIVATHLSDNHIDENASITVTGSLDDPGIEDLLAVVIDWGDGTTSNAVVDQTTRTFSATHQYLDDDPSGTPSDHHLISLTVSDSDGGATSGEIGVVTVDNVDPTIERFELWLEVGPQGRPSGRVSLTSEIGDVGELDTHTALIDWGDGTTSEVPAVVSTALEIDHTYAKAGTFCVSVTVRDDDGGEVTETRPIRIKRAHAARSSTKHDRRGCHPQPRLTARGPASSDEGEMYKLDWTVDGDGKQAVKSWTIDWGDGTVTSLPGHRRWASHEFSDDGAFTISITGNGRHTLVDTVPVVVANVAPTLFGLSPVSGTEGDQITVAGEISDPGSVDTFTLTIDWGDGTPLEQLELPAGTAHFDAAHHYMDDGLSTVTLTVVDDDGGADTDTIDVTIANAAPLVTGFAPVEPVVTEGEQVIFVGRVADAGSSDTHTAEILWGDGRSETVAVDPVTRTFEAHHVYGHDGSYDVTVMVTDNAGANGSATTTVTVRKDVPAHVTAILAETHIDEGGVVAVIGSIEGQGARNAGKVQINWGDGTTSTALVHGMTGTFSATHRYVDDDPSDTASDDYVVSVTVADDGTFLTVEVGVVIVDNVDPTIKSLLLSAAAWSPGVASGLVTLTAMFDDVGQLDTHTALINWGDGTITEMPVNVANRLVVEHVYANNGKFCVSVTIYDDDGGYAERTASVRTKPARSSLSDQSLSARTSVRDSACGCHSDGHHHRAWSCSRDRGRRWTGSGASAGRHHC